MTQVSANFETGVNGNAISTGDAGSATAFDGVRKTAVNGIASYDNTHVAFGSLAAKFGATAGGTASGDVNWSTALGGTLTDSYGRLYLYLTAYDTGNVPIINYTLGGSRAARIDFNATGKLLGFDNPAAALFPTFSTAIALNQLVRIEWRIVHSATVGFGECKLFNTASSAVATETQTGAANKNTLAGVDKIEIGAGAGATGNVSASYVLWMDNIIAGATSYPGVAAVAPANTVAPAVTGTTALGDTLTTTDGTWTGTPTPTFTYQWQRNGSNIGGATASTRVIAAADQGTTLRCVVTGTNTAGAVSANSNGVSIPAAAVASSGNNQALLGYLYTHPRG